MRNMALFCRRAILAERLLRRIGRIIDVDEDTLNLEIRKFLKEVGITSQREIEKVVRSGKVRGNSLQLRMTLSSETAPLDHVVEATIKLGAK
jgi:hypothetical protein